MIQYIKVRKVRAAEKYFIAAPLCALLHTFNFDSRFRSTNSCLILKRHFYAGSLLRYFILACCNHFHFIHLFRRVKTHIQRLARVRVWLDCTVLFARTSHQLTRWVVDLPARTSFSLTICFQSSNTDLESLIFAGSEFRQT